MRSTALREDEHRATMCGASTEKARCAERRPARSNAQTSGKRVAKPTPTGDKAYSEPGNRRVQSILNPISDEHHRLAYAG
jgi:hypothetical protein